MDAHEDHGKGPFVRVHPGAALGPLFSLSVSGLRSLARP
jgi:hypothetical protein